MLNEPDNGSGRCVNEAIQDAVNRFNKITFLAQRLMTLHGILR